MINTHEVYLPCGGFVGAGLPTEPQPVAKPAAASVPQLPRMPSAGSVGRSQQGVLQTDESGFFAKITCAWDTEVVFRDAADVLKTIPTARLADSRSGPS